MRSKWEGFAVLACAASLGVSAAQITIDHRWSNTDAQSLIGLPMGSHKTIVDKEGNLKWSQWNLKRRPLDTPIGFSSQMDGELAMEAFAGASRLTVSGQELYRGRYPFVVSKLEGSGLKLEELAFAVDPDARAGRLPEKNSGVRGMDVVRLRFHNEGAAAVEGVLKLSGRERNLPGHAAGQTLATMSSEDVALVKDAAGATFSNEDDGLTLALRVSVPVHGEKTLWIELPYEWPAARNKELSQESGEALLKHAAAQWDDLWARGTKIEFPQQELNDFYDSSIAYVLILTEYDAQGDLWALDGPAVYRQYWGRGEYFQARAMEVAGFLEPARKSVEHSFHILNDDGEWDGPPASGWPAWDNAGGNAGAVWDYYLFSRDRKWLEQAYPYLLRASKWIRDHREESTLEGVKEVPTGARPVKRMIASKCRPEPEPELKPGEKSYWFGLLPWSYGDSGLPEGHSYSHNFLAAYAEKVTGEAAKTLGHGDDAAWLEKEYAAYVEAIRASVQRAVTLEKSTPAYLPAMPTYPEGAYSQTFLAVYPTHLYAADDALVTGSIARMEREEKQGIPTNVAWAGPAGVWAGEAMNMAETYLLRGEKQKAAEMLAAAMNHSYTTKVWKEEILVDADQPRACETPHSKRANMEGTGDMPEAWANANLVLLLRDMLLNEREGKLHLLAGMPESWVPDGKAITVENAPVTTGGTVSLRVEHASAKLWRITVDPHGKTREFVVHLPVDDVTTVSVVRVNGERETVAAELPVNTAGRVSVVEVEIR
ncbi:MAG: hypothetical protein ABSC77_02245 [Terracidiphilus sp.]